MNPVANAVIVKRWNYIVWKRIEIPPEGKELIKGTLIYQRKKIVHIIKRLYSEGQVKSYLIPRNKAIQKELDNLVHAKREIDRTLNLIKQFYRK